MRWGRGRKEKHDLVALNAGQSVSVARVVPRRLPSEPTCQPMATKKAPSKTKVDLSKMAFPDMDEPILDDPEAELQKSREMLLAQQVQK